jgi:toluene monooxygenase system protein E
VTARRTYWHLEQQRRKPSVYEIASSRLLYYPERGFEVQAPLAAWYAQHQHGSPLRCRDWDAFADPRQTTYASYVELQHRRETYVDGLFAAIDATGYDQRLAAAWLPTLERVLAPLRYPCHGLQMAAAYVGHMAPGGRIVICAALQAGDEIRRVQRLAYRMRQLQATYPAFGADSKQVWQGDELWQPLRRLIEHLLVAYDWGEAFAALQLVVKPAFDTLFVAQLGDTAAAHGDEVLAKILLSLDEDCAWHRAWSDALVAHALADEPANAAVLRGWIARWREQALAAVQPFATFLELPGLAARVEAAWQQAWRGIA